ncbi:MAG: DUF559 domain-containing protein, partial [Bacteroidota bacterium]|nr:DUF559 domain-containing protein [Bacteroidota bacterium]
MNIKSLAENFSIDQLQLFFREHIPSFKPNDENLDYLFMEDSEAKEKFADITKAGEAQLKTQNGYEDLILLTAECLKELTNKSGKKKQYEIAKRILKEEDTDAAIFVFYDDKGSFRFSFIRANFLGSKRDFTSFKRYTYFVSPEQTNKTFINQISKCDFTSSDSIQDAFSVEPITKEFYEKLQHWYFWAIDNVQFPEDAEKEKNGREIAIIRMITRIMFIWFMKVRKLIPERIFDEDNINKYLKDTSYEESTYYKAILQNLFFATLNTKQNERRFLSEERGYKGKNEDFGNHNVFRYHDLFNDSEAIFHLFEKIPFLNGGLFECLDYKSNNKKDRKYIDGFTATKAQQPKVPNELFFSEEQKQDISRFYGESNKLYPVEGLIHLLNRFNFTIDENEPDDIEVALDPELLGSVFENLLASYNPETATTARKSTGSYYTPREIVNYMVEESLIAYLKNELTKKLTPKSLSAIQKIQADKSTNQHSSLQDKSSEASNNQYSSFQQEPPEKPSNQFSSLQGGVPEGGGGYNTRNTAGEPGSYYTYPAGYANQLNNLPYLKTFRRKLRNNLTPAEAKLWTMLKNKKLDGKKFRRQHSFANYILDFYCPEEKLAVELDGQGHFEASQEEYDQERDLFMEYYGIKVIRFENKWVWNNAEGLLDEIRRNFGWYNNPSVRHGRTAPLEKGEQPYKKNTWRNDSFNKGEQPYKKNTWRNDSFNKGEQPYKKNTWRNDSFNKGEQPKGEKKWRTDDNEYLKTENTDQSKDNLHSLLRKLISYDDENPFDENITKKLISLIDNIRVVDPAVGSGAFPMAVLNKLVFILNKIDPENKLWKKIQVDGIREYVKDPVAQRHALEQVEKQFAKTNNDYGRKLYLIEKCIYGVDIQQIAVEIAKLRFFISLLVDEDIDYEDKENNFGVEPLPNLDFKLMQGNSLISSYAGIDFDANDDTQKDTLFRYDEEYRQLIREFEELKHNYQNEPDNDKKRKYRDQIEQKVLEIFREKLNTHVPELKKIEELAERIPGKEARQAYITAEKSKLTQKLGFDIEQLEKDLVAYTHGRKDKEFFLWTVYFAEVFSAKGGFDVVIGNPPYVQLQKALNNKLKYADLYKGTGFDTFERTGDIYVLFYEKGMNMLTDTGLLCYITSNKWMRANYGKSLRRFLSQKNPLKLLDMGPGVFNTATVDTNILLINNGNNNSALKATIYKGKKNLKALDDADFMPLINPGEESWLIMTPEEQNIKKKIEKNGTPLKDWDINIYRGVLTGYNEAFIIDSKTKDELIEKDPKSAEIIKPVLRGRDIKRYKAEFADLWLINTHNGYKDENGNKILPINVDDYPAIKEHLDEHFEKLEKRQDKGVTPYNLRNCAYLEEFEKEKIVYQEMVQQSSFVYDNNENYYCLDTGRIITGKKIK